MNEAREGREAQEGNEVDFRELEPPAAEIIARYDRKPAAMLPLLHLVQERVGCISPEAEQWVSDQLGVAIAHVHEVVTFYTMFRTTPIGRCHIQVCTNLPCVLRGAEQVLAYLKERLGIDVGQTTADGRFTLSSVECLCACEVAPMAQVNDRYVGSLATSPGCPPEAGSGGQPTGPKPGDVVDRAAVDRLLEEGR